MKKPTIAEQFAEIDNLRTMKPKIPRTNLFGEDLHKKIDAAVYALEQKLTVDDIYAFGLLRLLRLRYVSSQT